MAGARAQDLAQHPEPDLVGSSAQERIAPLDRTMKIGYR
jgi:hypothetical protein